MCSTPKSCPSTLPRLNSAAMHACIPFSGMQHKNSVIKPTVQHDAGTPTSCSALLHVMGCTSHGGTPQCMLVVSYTSHPSWSCAASANNACAMSS